MCQGLAIDSSDAGLNLLTITSGDERNAGGTLGSYGVKTIVYIDDNIGSIELVERVLESRPGVKLVAVG